MPSSFSRADRLKANFDHFTELKSRYVHDINMRIFHVSNEVDSIVMFTQQKPWKSLDLAVRTSIYCNWRAHALNQLVRLLPLECKDHLIGGKALHPDSMLHELYNNSVLLYQNKLELFPTHIRQFYPDIERVFFEKIRDVQDNALRKMKISRYLKTCEVCGVPWLDYERLIHLATNPPVDSALTIGIVKTLLKAPYPRRCVFRLIRDEMSLEVLLCHAKEEKFDFWGVWIRKGAMYDMFYPTLDYMNEAGRNKFIEILLKYGFQYTASQANCYFFRGLCLRYVFNRAGICEELPQLQGSKNLRRAMLTFRTFRTFSDSHRNGNLMENISTLVCITRTIPEPYITPEEMFFRMAWVLEPSFRSNLRRICDQYKTARIFNDEEYRTYKPRNLYHLCRCKVRDILADNMKVPEGIKLLDVPETVKRYLELKY